MMFVYNYLFDKSNLAKCELRTEHLDIHSRKKYLKNSMSKNKMTFNF
jgi:hypothetical protein